MELKDTQGKNDLSFEIWGRISRFNSVFLEEEHAHEKLHEYYLNDIYTSLRIHCIRFKKKTFSKTNKH